MVRKLIEQPQTDTFGCGVTRHFVVVPVSWSPRRSFARKYPLTPELHQRLNAVLTQRRSGEASNGSRIGKLENLLI